MSSKNTAIALIVFAVAGSVVLGLIRLNGFKSSVHSEDRINEIVERVWPEENEEKLRQLDLLLRRPPLALTIAEQVDLCLAYTADAYPGFEVSSERMPGFALACLSTAAAISITQGDSKATDELVRSVESTRRFINERAGRPLPSPHEQCLQRMSAEDHSEPKHALTSYARCFRAIFYFSLSHANSDLVRRFSSGEVEAYERSAHEMLSVIRAD